MTLPRTRTLTRTLAAGGLAVLLALCVACTSSSAGKQDPATRAPLTVDTTSGRLHGTTAGQSRLFLGVRYGRSVAGARRWTMPVAAAKAAQPVEATKAGPSCAQAGTAPGASATASKSEDCLFLNVTTPQRMTRTAKLPVMVWWHGGGYTSGSGAAYDAQRLATRGNVIVVTVNYRLGVFGYLSLPGLTGSGDFGFADQILATRWAKRNAGAFGGDPDNITVFGESAGGTSACALLTSPAAKGLVDKIGISSGACKIKWPAGALAPGLPAQTPYAALADAQKLGTAEAATLHCPAGTAASCLRGKSVADLLKIFPAFSDALAYDTPLLPEDPARAIDDVAAPTDIDVLSGGNAHEHAAIVAGVQAVKRTYTTQSYPTLLRTAFGANASRVAAAYPLSAYPNAATAYAQLITDGSWDCPALRGNASLARQGFSVHGYEFADPNSPNVNAVPTDEVDQGGAHATDVPYLFDLTGKNLLRTAEQRRLGNAMIDYWTSFARTGTPRASGQPTWPRLTGADGPTLRLAPTIDTVDYAGEHHCDVWSAVNP